jgi:cellulose synthase/poly-beta-1,6-N-acetylglucosamine synthase-like glycosyltransferase
MPLDSLALGLYFATVILLGIFGVHRLTLVVLYFRHRSNRVGLGPPLSDAECPLVLVQLPIYNERFVIERLIDAVTAFDWPKDRLRIQILDDSTDDTVDVVARAVRRHQRAGIHITHVRRGDRNHYKAGALKKGLTLDHAPFVAMFDADFVPQPEFLRFALRPLVEDARVGMVQARWGHLNRESSLLTRAQAVLLDGHFVMEHGARFRSGRFFNFNGTAGVWRREAIDDAGGWAGDTLCEDLDLSYRAQLKGWRFVYLQDLVVPAELPADATAFKSQQHRWAKGSLQAARKLLPTVWRSDQPLAVKVEATFHMCNNLAYLGMVAFIVLLPPAILLRTGGDWVLWLSVDVPVFIAATFNLLLFYAMSEREVDRERWVSRLALVPFVIALGAALTPNNGRAVMEALGGHESPFVRTPKGGARGMRKYRLHAGTQAWIETAIGVYYLLATVAVVLRGLPAAVPFLLLFATMFLLLGLGSILPALRPESLHALPDLNGRTIGTSPVGAHTPPTVPSPAASSPRPQPLPPAPDRRAGAGR